MLQNVRTAGCVLASILGVAVFAGGAGAAPAPAPPPIDTGKVQALANQIEAALMQLGCGAPPPAVEAPVPPPAPPPPPPMRGERGALEVKPLFLRAAYTTVSAPTVQQDVAVIEQTIAASGVSPSEAAAALSIVQAYQGLCGNQSVAVASVNQTIELALASSAPPAAGPAGAPGGPAPIGPPPVFVGGGGSNYQTP